MKSNPQPAKKNLIFPFSVFLGLSACATSPAVSYVSPVADTVNIDDIRYCSGYSCQSIRSAWLNPDEWAAIAALFEDGVDNPAEERRRVSLAVGLYESFVGPKMGTDADKPESPHLFITTGQLDCIDEATNTSIFLHLLDNYGLIRFHTVEKPAQRGFIVGHWFHSTAVLRELDGIAAYAIDSWFYEPGTPAEVVPLEIWLDFWKPDKNKTAKAGD